MNAPGLFPVVSSLFFGFVSVALAKWLLLRLKSVKCFNSYKEFDLLPRYGTLYTSSYELIAPLFFTTRKLPMNVMFFERVSALCVIANGAPFIRTDFAFTRHLAILKASVAKHILMSKDNVQKSLQLYHFTKKWLRNGLITSDQEIWRDRRKKLAPTLRAKMVESYFQIFLENSMTLVSKLTNLAGQKLDIMPMLCFCSLDIIVETSTGIKMGIQKNEDSEYLRSIQTLTRAAMDRIYTPWSWFDCTFRFLPEGKKYFKALKYSRDFTMKVIEERQKALDKTKTLDLRHDKCHLENQSVESKLRGISFLDMVLEMHLRDKNFSLQDVQDEIETLLLAGHDTTTVNMGFVLFLLGLDKSRLGKVHDELDAVLGTNLDSPVEIDQLKDLTYLECVIKEAARLYPPVPGVARTLHTDVRIGDLLIPKGTSCSIAILHIHKDPEVYPEPEKFIPERFLPDAEKPIDPNSFLAFSAGPRSCAGFKFAVLEMKVVLSSILRRFNVESLVHRDKIIMALGMMQTPLDGLPLRFYPR